MRIPGRKWNPFLAMAEVLWILSGDGGVDSIAFFSNYIRNFQDDNNPNFHGAYGTRIRHYGQELGTPYRGIDQIQEVVRKLQADPQSRQAVIALWNPEMDNTIVSKDYPCNNMVYYSLREGVLDQTVVIRSNDLIWGTTYNAVQFTHLHALVAGLLGVEMGTFTYLIQNLHYYINLYSQTLSKVIDEAFTGNPIHALYPESFGTFGETKAIGLTWAGILRLQTVHFMDWVKYFEDLRVLPEEDTPSNWVLTYFRALALFCYMRLSENGPTSVSTESLVNLLYKIGEPIKGLILDFWEDSKNPRIQELVKACQKSSILQG
jgi:hypothetical protein